MKLVVHGLRVRRSPAATVRAAVTATTPLRDGFTHFDDMNRLSPEGIVIYMSPTRMSRWESAIRLVIEFNEAFNRHDVAWMVKLMSEDCVFENTDPAPIARYTRAKQQSTGIGRSSFAIRLTPTSRSRRYLALGCAVLCAGDTNGWILREIKDMFGESIYTR
jgi:hypothetical protein